MNIIEVQTVQAASFRILIEALKEILTDANFEFDNDGIKLIAMDSSHTVLVHLRLKADNFETFICKKKTIIGINLINFYKLMKVMGNNDTLKLFIEENDTSILNILIENSDKNLITKYKLNLMDLNEENIEIPPPTFESVITMPSTDFQKICRDMSNIADDIEIKSLTNQLIFSCVGSYVEQETIIGSSNNGMTFIQDNNTIIQGVYELKNLVLFSKCTNLCSSVELYLKNDFPLIIKYNISSLGEIKLCLAPKFNDN